MYSLPALEQTWYTLSVDANGHNGNLIINFNDTYFLTYSVTTSNLTGLSGYLSGNAGGRFDDFFLTANVPNSNNPLPSTLLLLGSGLLGLAGLRRFRKD